MICEITTSFNEVQLLKEYSYIISTENLISVFSNDIQFSKTFVLIEVIKEGLSNKIILKEIQFQKEYEQIKLVTKIVVINLLLFKIEMGTSSL